MKNLAAGVLLGGMVLALPLWANGAAGQDAGTGSGSGSEPEQAADAEERTAGTEAEALLARITALEQQLAELQAAADEAATEPEAEAEAEAEPAVDVALYGDFQIQGQYLSSRGSGTEDVSDVDLYYGEIGWDIACKESWSGHFSLNVDDDDDSVTLFEAWGKYQHPRSGAFVQLGQISLPFTNTNSWFPTYAATNDLGATTAKGLGIGIEQESWGIAAHAVNADVEVYGNELPETPEAQRRKIDEYSLWWDISRREADECRDGHHFAAGYISHLGNHDFRVVEGPVAGRVPGIDFFGQYDWAGGRWHAIAEYAAALKGFDPADLDADSDGQGDQPAAWNFELVHNSSELDTWGLGYQQTTQFIDHPRRRAALLYGRKLCELAELRLELAHGRYGDFTSDGRSRDTSFVAEFHVSF